MSKKPFNSIKAPEAFTADQINLLAGAVAIAALSERDGGLARAELAEIISGWLRASGLEVPETLKGLEWESHFQTLFEGLRA
jgi:hypothetical protein